MQGALNIAGSGLSVGSITDRSGEGTDTVNVKRAALFAGFVGLLYLISDHEWFISQYQDFSETSEFMTTVASEGNWIRRGALFALGGFAFIALLQRGGYRLQVRSLLSICVIAVIAWSAASLTWAIEPAIAVRRFIASGCAATAALAAAKWLRPRELAIAAAGCCTAYLAIGVMTEIALGTFQPWHGNYRFAGTLHPNNQGLNCALIVMASMYLAQNSRDCKRLWWILSAVGFGGLLLSRSRTPLATLVVAEAIFWFFSTSWPKRIAWTAAAICLAAVAMFFAGGEVADNLTQAALMGRGDEEELGALTGRVPLWEELSESIARRPLEGYGFSSFWIPRNIEDISESQYWAISVAHSSYLDTALSVGLIGLGLCLACVVLGVIRAVRFHGQWPSSGYGFIAVLLIFGLFHGTLESAFANPDFFVPLVGLCGLTMLAFVDPRQYFAASDLKIARHDEPIQVYLWKLKAT